MWRSIGKGVLFKTFDVKVQVQNVPKLCRQTFRKVLLLLSNVTYVNIYEICSYIRPSRSFKINSEKQQFVEE